MDSVASETRCPSPLGGGGGVLLAVMDRRLRFLGWTPAAVSLTGLAAADVLGRCLYDVFPEAPGTAAESQYFEALRTGRPVSIVTQLDGVRREIAAWLRGERLHLWLSPMPPDSGPHRRTQQHRTIP